MISRKVGLYILLLTAIVGCRDEFDPQVSDYEELLVVDGFVTNQQEPGKRLQVRYSWQINPELRALMFMPPEQYPVYLTNTNEGRAFASDCCFDCTLWGGELEPPEFWEDSKLTNKRRSEKVIKDKN